MAKSAESLRCTLIALAVAASACSAAAQTPSSGGAGGGPGAGGTGPSSSLGGSGGGAAGSGGSGTPGRGGGGSNASGGAPGSGGGGGAATGGGGGTGGAVGNDDAAAGDTVAGADGAGSPVSAATCTLFVGPSPMMQWFRGGFLQQPGIDAGKFELIWVAHHYTDAWAKPGDGAWNTALDNGHACAQNPMMPDRVVFQATQWSHTTAAQWETDFAGIVANIQKKWPSVKRIELMASTSAPGNKPCPAAGGKNNETIVPQIGYDAIDAMPAKFPGLVFALPHFEVPNCSDFIGNGTAPQYAPNATATTGPAVLDVAKMFAAYFAAHP